MSPDSIAIIGVSALFPGSPAPGDFWRNIVAAQDLITAVPESHWLRNDYYDADPKSADRTYCQRGAFLPAVPFNPLAFGVPPSIIPATDTSQLLALLLADRVLQDAGESGRTLDRDRIGVILGVTGTTELTAHMAGRMARPQWADGLRKQGFSEQQIDTICQQIADGFVPWQESTFPGLLGNVVAGRIANRFDLGGTNCVVDAACASSLAAISMAVNELRLGQCDLVIAGGVDTLNDPLMFLCFSKTPALSPTGDCRPFSDQADGTILGEGIAMFALRRLADAERDGDPIYAVLRGVGSSSDGRSTSVYAPRASGQAVAIRRAYQTAEVTPDTVELIEAHGTGTTVGDLAEFKGLKEVFSAADEQRTNWCALGSVKSQIGHTKAAAGAAGLFKAVMALHHRVLPPTAKVTQPGPELNVERSPFYLNTEPRPWVRSESHPRRAGVSSFGFGGSNFHLALEEYTGPSKRPHRFSTRPSELLVLTGSSPTQLSQAATGLSKRLTSTTTAAALRRLAWETHQQCDREAPFRLAVVADSAAEAADRLQHCAAQLTQNTLPFEELAGSYAGQLDPTQPTERIAFLFPGQGSQFVGMGRELAMHFDTARATWDRAAAQLPLHDVAFPPAAFSDEQRLTQATRLQSTEWAQPAIGACSLSYLRLLEVFGVRPDVVAGHSFGELTALHAAGVIDETTLISLARLRGEIMNQSVQHPGGMLAVIIAPGEQEPFTASLPDGLVVANHNSPNQIVVSGPLETLERFEQELHASQVTCRRLPVAHAFHSPAMTPASQQFAKLLQAASFEEARLPVYTNTEALPQQAPGALKEQLARQLRDPVRFQQLVQQMAADGVRVFIEVGPQQVLTALVNQCLPQLPVTTVSVSRKGRDEVTQFWHALGQLFVRGVDVDFTAAWDGEPDADSQAEPGPHDVMICGANFGRPYPDNATPPGTQQVVPTTSLVPPPRQSVPRQSVLRQSVPSKSAAAKSAPTKSATASSVPASPPPLAPAETTNLPADTTPKVVSSPSPTPTPITESRLMNDTPEHRSPDLLELISRQTAEAHQAFLHSLSSSHHAYLQVMQQALTGQPAVAHNALPRQITAVGDTPHSSVITHVESAPATQPPTASPTADATSLPQTVPASPAAASATDSHRPTQPHSAVAGTASSQPASATQQTQQTQPAQQSQPAQAPGVEAASAPERESPTELLLQVVADKTGYPIEVLELDMEIESDLGIDSIKRVEILSTLMERLPELANLETSRVGSLRTLREIADLIGVDEDGSLAASATSTSNPQTAHAATEPATSPAANSIDHQQLLLEVVAEKTGYPVEVLDLDMEIESGLGIDSIKRVEILSTLVERLPTLEHMDATRAGALRTLGDILVAMTDGPGDSPAPDRASQASAAAPTLPLASIGRFPVQVIAAPPTGFALRTFSADDRIWLLSVSADERVRDVAAELLNQLTSEGPTVHIVSELPDDAQHVIWLDGLASFESISASLELQTSLFRAARQMAGVGSAADRTLVTVQDGGGMFGHDEQSHPTAWHSGATGLIKTLSHEWPGAALRAIDIAAQGDTPATTARRLVEEILAGGTEVEVGLTADGLRWTLDCRSSAAESSERSTVGFQPQDVIVVSGGARGVTAQTLRDLSNELPCRFVLLGRTPLEAEPPWAKGFENLDELKQARLQADPHERPALADVERDVRRLLAQREVRSHIAALEQAGSQVRYEAVDLLNAAQVERILQDVRDEWGPIVGVIHAAGVLADRRIEDKTDEQFELVLRTKVEGLSHLLHATRNDPLRVLAMFSSVAARFGNSGQCDYAMANEVLNRLAHSEQARRGDSCLVKSLLWGPWAGGMVTPALQTHFEQQGIALIPLAAGGQAFVNEILHAPDHAVEVVLAAGETPVALSHTASAVSRLSIRVNRARYSFLDSHRIDDTPVIPLVMVLEWFHRAASSLFADRVVDELQDVRVLKGGLLHDFDRGLDLHFEVQVDSDQTATLTLISHHGVRHYSCRVHFSDQSIERRPRLTLDRATQLATWPWPIDEAYGLLFHGPEFRVLQTLEELSDDGGRAIVSVNGQISWLEGLWQTSPAIVDGAIQLVLLWGLQRRGETTLPMRIGRFRVFSPPRTGTFECHFQVRQDSPLANRFDVTLTSSAGERIAELEDIEMVLHSMPRNVEA